MSMTQKDPPNPVGFKSQIKMFMTPTGWIGVFCIGDDASTAVCFFEYFLPPTWGFGLKHLPLQSWPSKCTIQKHSPNRGLRWIEGHSLPAKVKGSHSRGQVLFGDEVFDIYVFAGSISFDFWTDEFFSANFFLLSMEYLLFSGFFADYCIHTYTYKFRSQNKCSPRNPYFPLCVC